MYQFIIIIHVLLGLGIIGLVLMQHGRGADAGAAFGSGSSGSVFGAQGSASFLSRTTAIFAALFFSTSLGLAFLSGQTTAVADLMTDSKVEKSSVDIPDIGSTPATNTIPAVPAQEEPVVVEPIKTPATGEPAQPEAAAPIVDKND